MKYIDTGYALALATLVSYGVFLVARHRRLRRLASVPVEVDDMGALRRLDG